MDKLQEDKRQTLEYKRFDDAFYLAEFVNKKGIQRSDIQKVSYSPKEDAYYLLWWEMSF